MSLTPVVKVTLRNGLSPEERQGAIEDISLLNRLHGMQESPSRPNVIYCGVDGENEVVGDIKKVKNVRSVTLLRPYV